MKILNSIVSAVAEFSLYLTMKIFIAVSILALLLWAKEANSRKLAARPPLTKFPCTTHQYNACKDASKLFMRIRINVQKRQSFLKLPIILNPILINCHSHSLAVADIIYSQPLNIQDLSLCKPFFVQKVNVHHFLELTSTFRMPRAISNIHEN